MNDLKGQILKLADAHKTFACGGAKVTYIRNDKRADYRHMFGFWKFGDSPADNQKVFDELEHYCCQSGITSLIGPMNYNTWFEYRLPVDNFDFEVFPDIPGNVTQTEFLDQRGYGRKWNYFSTLFEINYDLPQLSRSIDLGPDYKIYTASGVKAEQYAADNYEISLDCFADAPLYSPLGYNDYINIYLKQFADIRPNVVLIRHKTEPVAFTFGYENLDKQFYISKTIGIKKAYRTPAVFLRYFQAALTMPQKYGQKYLTYHYQNDMTFKKLMKGDPLKIKNYILFCKEF